ncbi:MAG: DEAD/DEAH box helicase, partial [Candidatus Korarchaeota archaeon]|nr:DEAD/DEAH box helicase [Candidatus Korarchaeota archaeon]
MRLYSHQVEALKALEEGKNVILISGTGSGKTEAWFFYAAKGKRALAIYPTLALANDQVRRLEEYSKALGISSQVIDARRRTILIKELGRSGLRTKISNIDLLITNPAFFMTDLKRMATKGSYLSDFVRGMDLLVVDELDFYGPRELALIVSMMRIISLLVEKSPQFVILTATLGNPEELAECLTSINARETVIIRGKPFRVRNEVYLVLGKNMERIWEVVQRYRDELLSLPIGGDLREAIADYKRFERDVYRVVELLRSVGIEVPQPEMDPAEVIYHYSEDDGVTLVFTRGIRSAESLKRRLKTEFGMEDVASHHHLVSKEEREEIE